MKEFKISGSNCHSITTGEIGLTANQENELIELQNKEKRTVIQENKLKDLMYKKANPVLPKGAKTYCKQWIKEQFYKRKKEFTCNYTNHGIENEPIATEMTIEHLNLQDCKFQQYKENDYMSGHCDILSKTEITDTKCSWDFSTFPILEDEIPDEKYYDQAQVYMALWGIENFNISYCLTDMHPLIIESEAKRWCYKNRIEYTELVYNKFESQYTYNNFKLEEKIKVFKVVRDKEYEKKIIERVKMCRTYINQLIESKNLTIK